MTNGSYDIIRNLSASHNMIMDDRSIHTVYTVYISINLYIHICVCVCLKSLSTYEIHHDLCLGNVRIMIFYKYCN